MTEDYKGCDYGIMHIMIWKLHIDEKVSVDAYVIASTWKIIQKTFPNN